MQAPLPYRLSGPQSLCIRYPMQTCGLLRRIHIKNERPSCIHGPNVMHIVIIKTEICNIAVLANPFLMHGLRDGAYPLLGQPAQYHLGRGLAITLANTPEDRIVENVLTAFSQRRPSHWGNPLLSHDLSECNLLGERMQLNLVDHGRNSAGKNQINQPVRQEIADPDGTDPALLVQVFHSPPRPLIIAIGHMDENRSR